MLWVCSLLHELCFHIQEVMPLYFDNLATIFITNNPSFYKCTKHIEIDCHVIRDKVFTKSSLLMSSYLVNFLKSTQRDKHDLVQSSFFFFFFFFFFRVDCHLRQLVDISTKNLASDYLNLLLQQVWHDIYSITLVIYYINYILVSESPYSFLYCPLKKLHSICSSSCALHVTFSSDEWIIVSKTRRKNGVICSTVEEQISQLERRRSSSPVEKSRQKLEETIILRLRAYALSSDILEHSKPFPHLPPCQQRCRCHPTANILSLLLRRRRLQHRRQHRRHYRLIKRFLIRQQRLGCQKFLRSCPLQSRHIFMKSNFRIKRRRRRA